MEILNEKTNIKTVLLVIVASLGYFVDIYDLLIFSIVRVKSFGDLGIPQESMRVLGEYVLNMQMAGLLLGGILWGIIGDKFGRVKMLLGSILLYSVANIANGFVQDIHTYAIIRFVGGLGLAGELGAGVTLISETMSKEKRGYGTMVVATIGILGALAAYYVSELFTWRIAYFVGGGIGLLLLLLRMGFFESGMYQQAVKSKAPKQNILKLLTHKSRLLKYVYCIAIGLPIWYVVGILVAQSPEIGQKLMTVEPLSAGTGIFFCYLGASIGDILAAVTAQVLHSRKKTVFFFQLATLVVVFYYLNQSGMNLFQFKWICFFLGFFGGGYWATFVTIASEQFGTNVRATVTTTAPNFVRGSLIPITFLFDFWVYQFDIITSGYIMIVLLTGIALFALSKLKESFGKDLNYLETPEGEVAVRRESVISN